VQDKCNSFKVTGWGGFVLKMIKLALKVSFWSRIRLKRWKFDYHL
jgi:hypothetical protein